LKKRKKRKEKEKKRKKSQLQSLHFLFSNDCNNSFSNFILELQSIPFLFFSFSFANNQTNKQRTLSA